MPEGEVFDIVVLGGGCAGITASSLMVAAEALATQGAIVPGGC